MYVHIHMFVCLFVIYNLYMIDFKRRCKTFKNDF